MKKSKLLLSLFILIAIKSLNAQTLYCEIKGSLINNTNYTYAYLYDFELKTVVFTPILNNSFIFKVQKIETYKNLRLFFEKDSTKNYEYFRDQAKTYRNNGRAIAVEDAVLEFDGEVDRVKVINGKFNEVVEEWYIAMKTSKLIEFIDKHHDSFLSLSIVKAFFNLNNMPEVVEKYDCKLLFNKLSQEIKDSVEGKEFFSKL